MHVILALRRWRQKDLESKANLDYIVTSCQGRKEEREGGREKGRKKGRKE
jgi:hypothetical protein